MQVMEEKHSDEINKINAEHNDKMNNLLRADETLIKFCLKR